MRSLTELGQFLRVFLPTLVTVTVTLFHFSFSSFYNLEIYCPSDILY